MSCTYGIEQSCDECRMCEKKKNRKVKVTEAEIVVHGTLEKPYFEIRYLEAGKKEYNVGYSSYDLKNVFGWLHEEFEIVKETNEIKTNADYIRNMANEEMAESRIDRIDIYCKSDTQMWIGDFAGIAENKEEAMRLEAEWLESEEEK